MKFNPELLNFLLLSVSLAIAELTYFRIADKYNIIDKPNERSSHTELTIRGGGVIFYLALLAYFLTSVFSIPYFFAGATLLAVISFIDDIKSVPNRIRLFLHFAAVVLLFYQLDLFTFPAWIIIAVFILVTGIINAYNFMDGINGITGGYSLINLLTLWYINTTIPFIDENFIIYTIISVLIFNFFNFRKKAKCFAGDVGSVTIAFVLIFLIIKLIIISEELIFALFLTVYGVDSIMTIIHRLIKKENIFKAHRSHLYQIMVSKGRFSHITVSVWYMIVQAAINLMVILLFSKSINIQLLFTGVLVILLTIFYWGFKAKLSTYK